jgi:hypothetical protein
MDLQKEIKLLERHLSLQGKLLEEDKDSITIQMANSILQVPREFIESMSDIEGISSTEGADKSRLVEVTFTKDAKIIQKTLVTPKGAIAGAITADRFNPGNTSIRRSRLGIDDCSRCTICAECLDCSECSICPGTECSLCIGECSICIGECSICIDTECSEPIFRRGRKFGRSRFRTSMGDK